MPATQAETCQRACACSYIFSHNAARGCSKSKGRAKRFRLYVSQPPVCSSLLVFSVLRHVFLFSSPTTHLLCNNYNMHSLRLNGRIADQRLRVTTYSVTQLTSKNSLEELC
ncbi:hypothetical protein NQL31_002399 [Lotmaria passim]